MCKPSWQKEIEDHTKGKFEGYILGTRKKRDGHLRYDTGGKEKLEDLTSGKMYGDKKGQKLPYFLIMNVEAIRYKEGRLHPISDELIKMVNDGKLNMIVTTDEIIRI